MRTGQLATSVLANMADNTSLDPDCVGQRYWYIFLMSSLFTFFGGLLIIFAWRVSTYLTFSVFCNSIRRRVKFYYIYTKLKDYNKVHILR